MNSEPGAICSSVLVNAAEALITPAALAQTGSNPQLAPTAINASSTLRALPISPNGDPALGVPHITRWSTTALPPSFSISQRETSPPIECASTVTSLPSSGPIPTFARSAFKARAVWSIGVDRFS